MACRARRSCLSLRQLQLSQRPAEQSALVPAGSDLGSAASSLSALKLPILPLPLIRQFVIKGN